MAFLGITQSRERASQEGYRNPEYDQQMAHTHMHAYFVHTEVTKVRTAPWIILATYLKGRC